MNALASINPVQDAIKAAAEKLADFRVTRLTAMSGPADFRDLSQDVRDIADILDPIFEAIGESVDIHSTRKVDLKVFETVVSDAIDGNATFEIERSADILAEDNLSMRELGYV